MKQETTMSNQELSAAQNFVVDHLQNFEKRRILIVGDMGLDEYVNGGVARISPEAPVPVVDVQEETCHLGLAGNVAQNVSSLGAEALVMGVVGKDNTAQELRRLFEQNAVRVDHLVEDPSRPTTRKMRIMSEQHHLVRVDFEQRRFVSKTVEKDLMERFQNLLPDIHGVIIEDYAKGVVSETLAQSMITACNAAQIPILVDPHITTPLSYYRKATMITPNLNEARALSSLPEDDLRSPENLIKELGEDLLKTTESPQMIITRGKDGMSLFADGKITHFPTYARQVFDVAGAGDTVIAALALGVVGGFSWPQACVLANYAAGVVVAKVGPQTCTPQEVSDYIRRHHL